MGEPPVKGWVQLILTLSLSIVVVGAVGVSGFAAALMVSSLDAKL